MGLFVSLAKLIPRIKWSKLRLKLIHSFADWIKKDGIRMIGTNVEKDDIRMIGTNVGRCG